MLLRTCNFFSQMILRHRIQRTLQHQSRTMSPDECVVLEAILPASRSSSLPEYMSAAMSMEDLRSSPLISVELFLLLERPVTAICATIFACSASPFLLILWMGARYLV